MVPPALPSQERHTLIVGTRPGGSLARLSSFHVICGRAMKGDLCGKVFFGGIDSKTLSVLRKSTVAET